MNITFLKLQIKSSKKRKKNIENRSKDKERLDNAILEFIVASDNPLSLTESKHFKQMMEAAAGNFKPPSRNYITKLLIPAKVCIFMIC